MCQPELLLGGVGTDAHNPLLEFLQGLLGDVVGLKKGQSIGGATGYLDGSVVLILKVVTFIVVVGRETTLLHHTIGKPALQIDHQLEHVIVGPSGKQDLSGVYLIQRAAGRPDVDGRVVR